MDTTHASPEPDVAAKPPPGDEDLSIDWGVAEQLEPEAVSDAGLALPPDLFGTEQRYGAEVTVAEPPPIEAIEASGDSRAPVEDEPFVLDELFPDSPEVSPLPAADRSTVVVEDLFAAATVVTTAPKPRLAPERREAGPPHRRRFDARKLGMAGAVVAVVVAVATLVSQPEDPSVDVRSAAAPQTVPTVPATTRQVPTTAAAATTTTVTAPPTLTAPAGDSVTTLPPATGGTGATAAPAPRATVAPSPVTTAAPSPPSVTPTSTASTATTVPQPEPTEPPRDTTETTRRPRETIPPTTSAPSTTTTVAEEEVVEAD